MKKYAKKDMKKQKQTQQSKLRKKAEILYAIRDFISILPYHFLVMGSVFIIATIFNKYLEAICFLIAFFSLRYKFDTTYHSKSIIMCMTLTITIFSLSIILCPSIHTYSVGAVLFGYLDCLALWFIQDRKEQIEYNKYLDMQLYNVMCDLKEYKKIDLWKMNETELRQYAQSKGLSESICDTLVLKVIHNYRWVDIQRQLNYSRDTIKYHKQRIIEKLKVNI